MSYKANVDIVVGLNALRIASFRKQGRLRFRLSLLKASHASKQTNVRNYKTSELQKYLNLLYPLQYLQTVKNQSTQP
jgi:hypothetical protein